MAWRSQRAQSEWGEPARAGIARRKNGYAVYSRPCGGCCGGYGDTVNSGYGGGCGGGGHGGGYGGGVGGGDGDPPAAPKRAMAEATGEAMEAAPMEAERQANRPDAGDHAAAGAAKRHDRIGDERCRGRRKSDPQKVVQRAALRYTRFSGPRQIC